jgi:hypothetical protein
MTPFEHEIIDLHIALENWLGKGEGDPSALLTRFRPDFLMIPRVGHISTIKPLPVSGQSARKPSRSEDRH